MSTHNVCVYGEIRKNVNFRLKKSILSRATYVLFSVKK